MPQPLGQAEWMAASLRQVRIVGLASSVVVEIRDGRGRAAATAKSLAEARPRVTGEAVIGVLG